MKTVNSPTQYASLGWLMHDLRLLAQLGALDWCSSPQAAMKEAMFNRYSQRNVKRGKGNRAARRALNLWMSHGMYEDFGVFTNASRLALIRHGIDLFNTVAFR